MKITIPLLKKYANNACSVKEKQAVELWLKNNKISTPQVAEEQWQQANTEIWQNISQVINKPAVKVIPLYKKIIRYAAVACVAMVVFFAGRLSTTNNTVALFAQQTNTIEPNNLLVYGGNGTHAKVSGNEFDIQFNGQLKLFNGSKKVKTVKTGGKTYTLQPMQTYVLMGDNQKSSMIACLDLEIEQDSFGRLKGDFAIKILSA